MKKNHNESSNVEKIDFRGCSSKKESAIIVLSDKKQSSAKLTIKNPEKRAIYEIKVDGCLISEDKIRCDYLIVLGDCSQYYVELKSKSHIEHALKQISATIEFIQKNYPELHNGRIKAVICSKKVPRVTSSFQNQKARFSKKYKAKIINAKEISIENSVRE